MQENRQPTEQETLSHYLSLAQQSLMNCLFKEKTKLYFITDNFYSGSIIEGRALMNNNKLGQEFPKGLDTFIEFALREPDCAGIVPFTERAKEALEKKGLEPTLSGMRLSPEEISFNVYGNKV